MKGISDAYRDRAMSRSMRFLSSTLMPIAG
jgi:hypothetical protein